MLDEEEAKSAGEVNDQGGKTVTENKLMESLSDKDKEQNENEMEQNQDQVQGAQDTDYKNYVGNVSGEMATKLPPQLVDPNATFTSDMNRPNFRITNKSSQFRLSENSERDSSLEYLPDLATLQSKSRFCGTTLKTAAGNDAFPGGQTFLG